MWRTIFREILVLLLGLALFPSAVILLLVLTDQIRDVQAYLARGLLSADFVTSVHETPIWIKWVSPYLAVQALRGYLWSQRSLAGRRWANLYFSFLLAFVGVWAFGRAWDLFYFMYAMGDLPEELLQFFLLEGYNLVITIASLFLMLHCLRIFLDPARRTLPPKKGRGTDPQEPRQA